MRQRHILLYFAPPPPPPAPPYHHNTLLGFPIAVLRMSWFLTRQIVNSLWSKNNCGGGGSNAQCDACVRPHLLHHGERERTYVYTHCKYNTCNERMSVGTFLQKNCVFSVLWQKIYSRWDVSLNLYFKFENLFVASCVWMLFVYTRILHMMRCVWCMQTYVYGNWSKLWMLPPDMCARGVDVKIQTAGHQWINETFFCSVSADRYVNVKILLFDI